MPDNKHLRFFVIILYCLLGVVALWLSFKFVLPALAPFIIAFIFAKIIERPVDFCTTRLKFPRALSSGVWTVIAFGTIGTALYFALSLLFRELSGFIANFSNTAELIKNAGDYIGRISDNVLRIIPVEARAFVLSSVENFLNEGLSLTRDAIAKLGGVAASALGSVPGVFLFVIVMLAATFFLSSDYPNLRKASIEKLPKRWKAFYNKMRTNSIKALFAYLRALGILWCITFVELCIGFSILGFDYVLAIAFFTSIIDILPVFGVGTVLIPWAIYQLIVGNYALAIGLAVLYGVIVVVRNLIEPKIVGKQIGLNPLITLLSVYVGLKFFGLFGIVTPIFVVLARQIYLSIKEKPEDETETQKE